MELSLSEKLLLLAVDDEKGTLISGQMHLHYGLAGSLLLEMTLSEKIDLEKDRVVLKQHGWSKDPMVNLVTGLIKKSTKSRKLKYWVNKVGNKGGQLKKDIIANLIRKGILRKQEDKVLWIIPYTKYPTMNAKPENQVRRELHDIVIRDQEASQENLMLLGLVQACGLIKEVFPRKEDYKIAKKKIKTLTTESKVAKAVDATIQEVQAAVMIAVMSATIASTASSAAH